MYLFKYKYFRNKPRLPTRWIIKFFCVKVGIAVINSAYIKYAFIYCLQSQHYAPLFVSLVDKCADSHERIREVREVILDLIGGFRTGFLKGKLLKFTCLDLRELILHRIYIKWYGLYM